MRNFVFAVAIGSLLGTAVSGYSAPPLDDFSGTSVDSSIWKFPQEYAREISNGKFVSKAWLDCSKTNLIQTGFANPELIQGLQAKVTIIAGQVQGNNYIQTGPQLEGFFYAEAGGDVWAGMNLGYDSSGNYSVFYGVNSNTDGFQNDTPFSTIAIEPNKEYTLTVSYNGDRGFTFVVSNGVDPDETKVVTGPVRTGSTGSPFMALTSGLWGMDSSCTGYTSNTFDDVYVDYNNDGMTGFVSYDSFSTAPLDPAKWADSEVVLEIRNEKLQMNVQNFGSSQETTNLILQDEHVADYIQADATITSDTVLTGTNSTYGELRIMNRSFNYKYNGSGYNNYDGEVYGQVRIRRFQDGTMYARGSVFSCDGSNCENSLYSENFECAVTLDTPVTLSIEEVSDGFIFGCNGEKMKYTSQVPLYPPSEKMKLLRNRLYSTTGESGYFHGTWDNVYVKKKGLLLNLVPVITTNSKNN